VRTFRPLLLLIALALLGTACSSKESASNPLERSDEGGGWVARSIEDLDEGLEIDEPIQPGTGLGDDSTGGDPGPDDTVRAALSDVESFWARTYEDVYGEEWEPISGGYWAYGPDTEIPECGAPLTYEEVAQNAFYCPIDDLVAWDAYGLVPDLYDEFGGFTLGIVFAHEFGHAVQARAGVLNAGYPTIVTEMQADCFAGAWTADVEAGNAKHFELTLADLDRTMGGFLTLRDTVGTSADDPSAHGTGFDRIGSFIEGYELGPEYCAEYVDRFEDDELVIVQVPFTDPEDFERGGNLPLTDLLPLLVEDLESFWANEMAAVGFEWTPVADIVLLDPDVDEATCGEQSFEGDILVGAAFFCVPSDTIFVDAVYLLPQMSDEIGDFAAAVEIIRQYAYAAQVRMGNMDTDTAADLQADCYTGAYALSAFVNDRVDQSLILSPGDLDEAVIAFLQRSGATDREEPTGDVEADLATAFARFQAFRSGFLYGMPECGIG